MTEIWLARHGATEWSRSGQHTGTTDLPLIADGEEEARQMAPRLGGIEFGTVMTSPLQRARETARLAGFPDPRVNERLREIDYGEYEGVTTKDIQKTRPHWELFRDGCPGGETPEQMANRMDELLLDLADEQQPILLFGHGHCLRALAARYLGLPIWVAGVMALDAGSLSRLG
ncbi:MAG TPA: histidine phosphatase family protein, partial [Actinomycetota bacterium]|nr:histidine phosphatase family protein [Actinomycetota bacterium]